MLLLGVYGVAWSQAPIWLTNLNRSPDRIVHVLNKTGRFAVVVNGVSASGGNPCWAYILGLANFDSKEPGDTTTYTPPNGTPRGSECVAGTVTVKA